MSPATYQDLIEKTREENRLFSVMFELTYRCNLDCVFCYNDVGLQGTPLSLERYYEVFEELASMGVLHLILTGGEPLAHPHFFAMGARARELGFAVRVKSNGHALRGAMAKRLHEEVDPMILEMSLHGACAETHDRQTRVPGSFDRLLANLAEMRDLGLRMKINSTVTRWNEAEIEAMYAITDELGLPLQFDPEVTIKDDGDRSPLDIAPSREGLLALFRLQEERRQAFEAGRATTPTPPAAREGDQVVAAVASTAKRYCGAGTNSLTVDPYGNVYPCVQWRRPVGNLHENSVTELWAGSEPLDEVRSGNERARSSLVKIGSDANLSSFCPGQAVLATGVPDRLYDDAAKRIGLRQEAAGAAAKDAAIEAKSKDGATERVAGA
ncbi:MAG: radical SAM protein [Thermoanaerobaculia bacterium]|nr:radical SAM protein [Thermoanaerobaculia bacterium]